MMHYVLWVVGFVLSLPFLLVGLAATFLEIGCRALSVGCDLVMDAIENRINALGSKLS